jgi:hypothetical protein
MSIIPARTVRWVAVAAAVATSLSVTPSLAGSAPTSCRVALPVTISPAKHHAGIRAFTGSGSASCTGTLGRWRLGSGSGWSVALGTLKPADSGLNGAKGQLVAAVPRFGFPRAPMVLFTTTLRVRFVGSALVLTGSGHLVPTVRSPDASKLTITGTGTLTTRSHRTGVLTLQFSVGP